MTSPVLRLLFAWTLCVAIPTGAALADKSSDDSQRAGDKRVCRTEVPTGSTMPRHVCHTRSEWQMIDAAVQEQSRRDRLRNENGMQRNALR